MKQTYFTPHTDVTKLENERTYTLQQLLTNEFITLFTQFGSFELFLQRTQLAGHEVIEPRKLSFIKRMKINFYIRNNSMFQSLEHLLHLAQEYKVKKDMMDQIYKNVAKV